MPDLLRMEEALAPLQSFFLMEMHVKVRAHFLQQISRYAYAILSNLRGTMLKKKKYIGIQYSLMTFQFS